MVSTHCNCKVEAETQTKALQPTYADVSTQTDLPRTEIAVQTSGCMELQHLEAPLTPEGSDKCHSCKCAQLELLKQVAMLQEELNRQHSIQECERLIGVIVCCPRLSDSPALRLCKGKMSLNPTLS